MRDGPVAYGEANRAPKALAVIVNPSPTNTATIAVRAGYGPPPRISLGNTAYTFLCSVGTCAGEWCGVRYDEGPQWAGPLTWTGNKFALEAEGARITGEISADRLAAADHILVAHPLICADNHSGIDYTQPVLIEIWFGP